ncbi:MAG: NADH-quinone oxidoreductase subunit H [Anaerolineaceae bacterium]|nr:NADH-quinone oxidoreductase subunit H [Anaerolineaceae bacterium]
MNWLWLFFQLLIFPGALFLIICAMFFEWIYRINIAQLEGRIGPKWYQPFFDILKLISKEDILPVGANRLAASFLPVFSLGCVLTAGVYVPVAGFVFDSFEGDLIMVIILLSVPSLAYFLNGWATGGSYSLVGANRSLLQYFTYEVPFLTSVVGTAFLSSSWSIIGITQYQNSFISNIILAPLGFFIALIALIGKLKRNPFDIPKAKSEVIAGPLTETSGESLALWHLTLQVQALVGIFLLINLFLGKSYPNPLVNSLFFAGKAISVQLVLGLISVSYARMSITNLTEIGWRFLVPLSLLQFLGLILLKVLI